jgi:AAHS family 4-hydroxybenzoate transporter-like MFS transporter
VVVAALLWWLLPESPMVLARNRERWPELIRVLRQAGHQLADTATFISRGAGQTVGGGFAQLLERDRVRDTIAICVAFFFGLMTYYVVVLLLPALLTGSDVGFSQPTASRALAMWNYGGVVAAILGAIVIQRVGSRVAMVTMAAAAAVCGVALGLMPLDATRVTSFMIVILLAGAFVNGVQTTMYALAAHVFPPEVRSTGVGTSVAIGRIGNVLAAYTGSIAIDRGGLPGYFFTWSAFMLIVLVALLSIRRQIAPPRLRSGQAAT